MSAEEKFQCESWTFLFAVGGLFWFLYGVAGSVGWCFSVTFNVGMREVLCWFAWCLGMLSGGSAGKRISEEEERYIGSALSSTCVTVVSQSHGFIIRV